MNELHDQISDKMFAASIMMGLTAGAADAQQAGSYATLGAL